MKSTINQVLSIVTDPAYKSANSERREKLREVIAPRFDFTDMARSAMGYHWRSLSQTQRDQFVRTFHRPARSLLHGQDRRLQRPGIDYVKETQDGEQAQVNTNIVSEGNEPISVNYRLKQSGGSMESL